MPRSPSLSNPAADDALFPVFALVWASATLIHQIAASFWMAGWAGWLLVVAAFAVLFEPRCLLRFAAMIIASLLNLYQKLPFVPNHILLEGMLHVTMLLALLQFACTGKLGSLIEIRSRLAPRAPLLLIAAAAKALFLLAPSFPGIPSSASRRPSFSRSLSATTFSRPGPSRATAKPSSPRFPP